MAVCKSSLSVGAAVRAALAGNAAVAAITGKIFPVITDEAQLPYVVYRRAALEAQPQKSRPGFCDTVSVEVYCYAAKYSQSIELAEAVREALDLTSFDHDGLRVRSCVLTDSEESFADDAYIQQLVFTIKSEKQ